MTTFFTSVEGSILVRLLIAHFTTDFLLQPDNWVTEKRKKKWASKYLWYHGLLTAAVAALLLWNAQLWWVVLLIAGTHVIIDGLKLQTEQKTGNNLLLFIMDQVLHLLVIVIVWLWVIKGFERMNGLLKMYLPQYKILIRLLGYILMVGPVGYVIQFMTRKWMNELDLNDSLPNAGKWIGILERVLTLTFVYLSQFGAIGFLITAKSLLRVIDKPARHSSEPGLEKPFSPRKHTEYVLIGTFLSFSIAILTGLLINWLSSL